MPLPKVQHPIVEITIPSTGEKRKFRPFITKEEKILLTAELGGTKADIIRAIYQIINNCSLDDLDVDELTVYDFDYVFIKLRATSINNIVTVVYSPAEDEQYTLHINLDEVIVSKPSETRKKVITPDGVTILMKHAEIKDLIDMLPLLEDEPTAQTAMDVFDHLLLSCVDKIYDDDQVYDDYTKPELIDFFEQQPSSVYEDIRQFVETIPQVEHTVKFKRNDGTSDELTLKGIDSFFAWR